VTFLKSKDRECARHQDGTFTSTYGLWYSMYRADKCKLELEITYRRTKEGTHALDSNCLSKSRGRILASFAKGKLDRKTK
jgi:hypothetical protein